MFLNASIERKLNVKITEEMVDYIAELSRLELSPDDRTRMTGELESVISYMDLLNGLDTEGVEPMSHVLQVQNVFRPDEVKASLDRELLLKEAPQRDAESFVVPKTVE